MNTITTQSKKIRNALIHGLEINGKSIVQLRDSDGFVNLTFMCKAGGKRSAHYLKNKQTTAFVEALREESTTSILEVKHGNPTWAHPIIAQDCMRWIFPTYCVNPKKANPRIGRENIATSILVEKLNQYQREVKCEYGFIDILTPHYVIEVKSGKNWKAAIGQVICYGLKYPKRYKVIALFDCKKIDRESIFKCCKELNIEVWLLD